MRSARRFIPRLEPLEERALLSASPLLVMVHAEPIPGGTMLVTRFTQTSSSAFIKVLEGQSQPLNNDTVEKLMPQGIRSAILAMRGDDGTTLPILRLELDGQGRIIQQTELSGFREALD